MDDRRPRISIVGDGVVGVDHAVAYVAQPDAGLAAFVGHDPARSSVVAGRFGARPWVDMATIRAAERVNAVSVCTPTGFHRQSVKEAAARGRAHQPTR